MKAQLRHVGIRFTDVARTFCFYQNLGFDIDSRIWSREYTDRGIINIIKFDNQIELINGNWMNHFALTVDSLDDFKHLLPDKPVFSKETDKVKVCYIQDPDGNMVELVEEKK